MTFDDYQTEWEQDAPIRSDELDAEARRVPLLHAKWWRFYASERLRYKKLDLDYKTLYRLRWEYWLGKLDDAERLAHGWDVQPLKVLSTNVSVYLDADSVFQGAVKKKILGEGKTRFLEDVIKSINK